MRIEVGDLVFDTVVFGEPDGEVVLLLHGFPQSSWCWRHVWPSLVEAGYRVVAPDQRGYSPGARPEGVAAYAMSELVADALGVLDAVGAERAHVVGHDWGAAVAWQLGARHPDRVRTLTPVCVPHPVPFTQALMTDPDQQARSRYMLDFQQVGTAEESLLADDGAYFRSFFTGAEDVADVDRYLAEMREPGRLTACLNWYRAASRASVDGFPPVTVPTTYVWPDGDLALGRTAAEATAAHVDGPYRFVELAGVSHWVPEQVPEQLSALLLEQFRA
jgi:pimeloyl-ACP methyl ester carboxylesterase